MPKHSKAATAEGLTPKEARFVAEYLIDGNGTRAAAAAGYSEGNAAKQAYQLMKRQRVMKAIEAARGAISTKLELTAEKVLANIARIGQKAEKARRYGEALKAEELLGKHLKLFTEKHEHGGIGGGPVQFAITEREAEL
jgi:phage terminase small subunit